MTDIALFPIPNCVAFPGTVYPLHVFEPRYRKMVQTCVDLQLPMAVCHVEKVVHQAPDDQPIELALQSNQDTYKPVGIVSAGPCEIVKTLPDGRLMINVHLRQRYQLVQETQTLPFSIYQAEPLEDHPLSDSQQQEAIELKDKLLHRLIALTADRPEIAALLQSDEWQQKPVTDFSYELFGILQTDPNVMQQILELESPLYRMKTALALLSEVPAQW